MTEQNTCSISELQQQATAGNVQAQFDLAYCYACGAGIEVNRELALGWLTKAAELGLASAQLALGYYYIGDLLESVNDEYSQKEFRKKIFKGMRLHTPFFLGVCLDGFENADVELGFKWLLQAAEQNSSESQYWLARCYYEGIGTAENDELAFKWFKKAADQGYNEAIERVAHCYFEGKGVGQNDGLAFEWFKKAADQDYAEAQHGLACCYLEGRGVEQSYALTFEWNEKSSKHGYAEAKNWIEAQYIKFANIHFDDERFTEQKDKVDFGMRENSNGGWNFDSYSLQGCRIFQWYLIAAEKGSVNAKKWLDEQSVNFASIDFNYKKFFQDDVLVFWLTKAAEQGVAEAQYRLALCYFDGKGVKKDYEIGMKWMIDTAAQGHAEANNWFTNAYLSLVIPSYISAKEDADKYYRYAFDWCIKELDGHNATEAYLLLGVLYYSGKGVEQSDERAIGCFEKAEYISDNCYTDPDNNGYIDAFIHLFLSNCYAQGKGVAKHNCRNLESYFWLLGKVFVEGIIAMPFYNFQNNKVFLTLLRISVFKKAGEYELAKEFTKEVFDKEGMDKNFKEICLTGIEQEQEIVKQNEAHYKALHEKEKEMLSFFTHTMRNALATAPESLRQAIQLLGSEVYEKDTKHYQAINKIAALFSTLSLTDCLIDTFKQSISDPQEFKQSWQKDHSGEATPKWVIASALRQSLNRIIFMSDAIELRKLLNNPETALIKATRKSFIEEVLPLNIDSQGVDVFYGWTLNHISAIDVSITGCDELNFGVNQIRFSLLFAITSELILNALKYWDGENCIQVSWQLAEQDNYVFSVKNHCKTNATSNLAGTHKGLAFIKRLVELLGEQAQFVCKSEDQLFTAELILNKALLNGES